jgi:hypothetical protein
MKIFSFSALIILLFVMFGSLLHVESGMNMDADTEHCLFMNHDEVICSMSMSEHVTAWQSVFQTSSASSQLLFIFVAFALAAALPPHIIAKRQVQRAILFRSLLEKTYTYSHRFLQDLFARGILHPKLY